MSLTAGSAPFGIRPAGVFRPPITPGTVYVEAWPRRVRGIHGGRVVVDSERTLLVHVPGSPPVYAFPLQDVLEGYGAAQPYAPGHVSLDWYAVDAWFEEEEEIRGYHPRNPYHRVDCLPSRRRLHVEIAGVTVVDTDEVTFVSETSTPPRLYVARSAVRMDLLRESGTTGFCGYKGRAVYFSAGVGDVSVDDVAWSYVDTLHEGAPIKDLLSFDLERAKLTGDIPQDWVWRGGAIAGKGRRADGGF